MRVLRFIQNHPDAIVLATGDPHQLHIEDKKDKRSNAEWKAYTTQCLDVIFPHEIFLTENKRLDYPEDRETLPLIYDDLFVKKMPRRDVIDKYFKWTDSMTTCENNIAYENATCSEVAAAIRKKQNRKKEYCVGEFLVCRGFQRIDEDIVCKKNFEYEIKGVREKQLLLKEAHTDNEFMIDTEVVRKQFIFKYCKTVFSMQGTTIQNDKPLCIFEWEHWGFSTEHFWVAITRVRGLKNVYFYNHKEDRSKDKYILNKYLQYKVEGYLGQDKNRTIIKDDYITPEWFMDKTNISCHYCHNDFNISIDRKCNRVQSDITADRLNNAEAHHKENCVLCCVHCNVSKK